MVPNQPSGFANSVESQLEGIAGIEPAISGIESPYPDHPGLCPIYGAPRGSRTLNAFRQQVLNLSCMPIPPSGHILSHRKSLVKQKVGRSCTVPLTAAPTTFFPEERNSTLLVRQFPEAHSPVDGWRSDLRLSTAALTFLWQKNPDLL